MPNACGLPSNNTCKFKYVIEQAFTTRQNCRSEGRIRMVAGGYSGYGTETKFSDRSFAGIPDPSPVLRASPSLSRITDGAFWAFPDGAAPRIQQIFVADHNYSLGQSGHLFVLLFDALDYERSRSAAHYLRAREAVEMRMIPIQPGRLVLRNAYAVFEAAAPASNRSVQHVILMTHRRDREAVKM